MREVTSRPALPITAYSSWRLKKRKLEPYLANADTELADRTMTSPAMVSSATERDRVARVRRTLRSALALIAAGDRSPGRTRRRRGIATASLCTRGLRTATPGRDRPRRGGETFSPFLVVT